MALTIVICLGGQRFRDKALAEDILRSGNVQRVYAALLSRDGHALTNAAAVLLNLSMTRSVDSRLSSR